MTNYINCSNWKLGGVVITAIVVIGLTSIAQADLWWHGGDPANNDWANNNNWCCTGGGGAPCGCNATTPPISFCDTCDISYKYTFPGETNVCHWACIGDPLSSSVPPACTLSTDLSQIPGGADCAGAQVYAMWFPDGELNIVEGGGIISRSLATMGFVDTWYWPGPGVFTLNVSGGYFYVQNNRWAGSPGFKIGVSYDHVVGTAGSIGGTGILNVSGGHVKSHGVHIYVGGDVASGTGTGYINQTGGLIEAWDPPSGTQTLNRVYVGGETNSYGEVNLNGGVLASRNVPAIGTTGIMYIDGGKLMTRDVGAAEGVIRGLISLVDAGIVGANNSNDPDDGNWKIAHVHMDETAYYENVLTVQSPIPDCETNVIPYKDQNVIMSTASPGDFVYTVKNEGKNDVNYTVAESPDQPWASLDKTSGGPIAGSPDGKSGGTDTVTVTIDSTTMTAGQNYSIDLVFTDDCTSPGVSHTRTLNITVIDCLLGVTPDSVATAADMTVYSHCAQPQSHTLTVTNSLGAGNRNYTVQEVDSGGTPNDYGWLSLDKTSGGPVPPGASDTVTATITGTPKVSANWDKTDTAYLLFTPDCGDAVLRRIDRTDQSLGDMFGFQFTYKGDVDPLVADSCSSVPPNVLADSVSSCNFTEIGSLTGTVVTDENADPDYAAQNGMAFLIDQSPGPDPLGRNGYASNIINANIPPGYEWAEGINNHFYSPLGTTMVARVKVVRSSQMEAMVWARDDNPSPPIGARVLWGGAGPDQTNQVHEAVNNITTAGLGLPKPDAYHIVRFAQGYGPYGQHTIKIWMDENPTAVLEISPSNYENEMQYDAFCFGTYGLSSSSKVYYDWISFTDAGMYGPGEEDDCLGSLIPIFCPKPFADADEDG
ncbi:MAG: COG1470 family protein, partial [Planctomycetota bacterium]